MRYQQQCERCGAIIDADCTYCPRCGARVHPPKSGDGQFTPGFLANDAFADGPGGISRGLAAVLAIVGGAFGIQYFYTRKTTAGIICLIFSICSCGSLGALLGLCQGIYMFTINNQKFYNTYVATNSTFPLF